MFSVFVENFEFKAQDLESQVDRALSDRPLVKNGKNNHENKAIE
jgi:hypothetical protein